MASIKPQSKSKTAKSCKALVENGEFERAIKIANTISDENMRSESLKNIALGLNKNKKTDRAIEIVNSIANARVQMDTIKNILQTLIENENPELVIKIILAVTDENIRREGVGIIFASFYRTNRE